MFFILFFTVFNSSFCYFSFTNHYHTHLYPSRNTEKILGYLNTGVLSRELIPPHINFSHLTVQDYSEMYGVIQTVKEDSFGQMGLDPCVLEDELNKVPLL